MGCPSLRRVVALLRMRRKTGARKAKASAARRKTSARKAKTSAARRKTGARPRASPRVKALSRKQTKAGNVIINRLSDSVSEARAYFVSANCGKSLGKGAFNEVFENPANPKTVLRVPHNPEEGPTQLHVAELHRYLAVKFPDLVPKILSVTEVRFNGGILVAQELERVRECGTLCTNTLPGLNSTDSYVVHMLLAAVGICRGNIYHGDINTGNLIVTEQGARLLDFDATCITGAGEEGKKFECPDDDTFYGDNQSPQMMPPEIICSPKAKVLVFVFASAYWRYAAVLDTMITFVQNGVYDDDDLDVFRNSSIVDPMSFANADKVAILNFGGPSHGGIKPRPGHKKKAEKLMIAAEALEDLIITFGAFYKGKPCTAYASNDARCREAYAIFMCAMTAMTQTCAETDRLGYPWRHTISNPTVKRLVYDCLHPVPTKRPTTDELAGRLAEFFPGKTI